MVNKALFKSAGRRPAETDTVNKAGGIAYSLSPKEALARFACTGTFGDTFYAKAQTQLSDLVELATACGDGDYLAKLAIYSRQRAFMKDMPCALLVGASVLDPIAFRAAAPKVLDNGLMIKRFVALVRSGQLGRKSLGTGPRNVVRDALNGLNDWALFNTQVGDPSIRDVLRMVRPKATDPTREAFYGYLVGKFSDNKDGISATLPEIVYEFERFKATRGAVPRVDSRLLDNLELTAGEWKQVALRAKFHQCRMSLNAWDKQGILRDPEVLDYVCAKLASAEDVRAAKVFPYQVLAAYRATSGAMPARVTKALHDALELATANVPEIPGGVALCVDTSGSMKQPMSGRGGSWLCAANGNQVSCCDVAALVTCAILRKNPDSVVIPFDTRVRDVALDPFDTVITNAGKIRALSGGGTNVGCSIAHANERALTAKTVIIVSDNMSWAQSSFYGQSTSTEAEFVKYRGRVKNAKLVMIDLVPGKSTQANLKTEGRLQVGGFSDDVFRVTARFASGDAKTWTEEVDAVALYE